MKELIIVGASGYGREVLQWCKEINKKNPTWIIKGFIDDNPMALEKYECDYLVIGSIQDWMPGENEMFALALANPVIKEKVVSLLKGKGAIFTSVIHPEAIISDFVSLGEGIVMYPGAGLSPNTKVGDFVTLISGAGHDAVIEDYATISGLCDICGHVHIGKGAYIGSHSTVIPNKIVGAGAYVGAGSIVIRSVAPGKKVFGNPARVLDI